VGFRKVRARRSPDQPCSLHRLRSFRPPACGRHGRGTKDDKLQQKLTLKGFDGDVQGKVLLTHAVVKSSLGVEFTIVNTTVADLLSKSLASQPLPGAQAGAGLGWRRKLTLPSLPEAHRTIPVAPNASWVRKVLAFAGPGYLIAVGYMDPGNWATDIGGSKFGYTLLSVVLLSSLFAMFLQALSAKLGVATGRDLAQACRDHYSRHGDLSVGGMRTGDRRVRPGGSAGFGGRPQTVVRLAVASLA
jgi:Natural resistance-associated macrophage protein